MDECAICGTDFTWDPANRCMDPSCPFAKKKEPKFQAGDLCRRVLVLGRVISVGMRASAGHEGATWVTWEVPETGEVRLNEEGELMIVKILPPLVRSNA